MVKPFLLEKRNMGHYHPKKVKKSSSYEAMLLAMMHHVGLL